MEDVGEVWPLGYSCLGTISTVSLQHSHCNVLREASIDSRNFHEMHAVVALFSCGPKAKNE